MKTLAQERRYGRFYIPSCYVLRDSDRLLPIFNGMLIVDAKYDCAKDAFKYVALFEKFDSVEEGEHAPLYRVELTKEPVDEQNSDYYYTAEFARA